MGGEQAGFFFMLRFIYIWLSIQLHFYGPAVKLVHLGRQLKFAFFMFFVRILGEWAQDNKQQTNKTLLAVSSE